MPVPPIESGKTDSSTTAALRNFTAQWFLLPQGTGIIAVILHELGYQFSGLYIISYIFWILACLLLLSFLVIYIRRCIAFPREVLASLGHDINEVACLSSVCISYTSIIQMMSLSLVNSWGPGWGMAVFVLWWTNVVMALVTVVAVPFVYIRLYPNGIPHLSPASQLPMIAALTVSAGGGTISKSARISPELQIPVLIVSYLFLGIGLPLAFALDVLFWARLLDRSLPDKQRTFQDMILCGPWGQASFALQGLGGAVLAGSFASYSSGVFLTAEAAIPVGHASIFAGLLCWGTGTFWWLFAIISILHGATDSWKFKGIPYGLACWSLVFPWVCLHLALAFNWL